MITVTSCIKELIEDEMAVCHRRHNESCCRKILLNPRYDCGGDYVNDCFTCHDMWTGRCRYGLKFISESDRVQLRRLVAPICRRGSDCLLCKEPNHTIADHPEGFCDGRCGTKTFHFIADHKLDEIPTRKLHEVLPLPVMVVDDAPLVEYNEIKRARLEEEAKRLRDEFEKKKQAERELAQGRQSDPVEKKPKSPQRRRSARSPNRQKQSEWKLVGKK